MTKTTQPQPLVGSTLIDRVKELGTLSKEEKAKKCGYYTVTKNGVERVNMMKFLNALIDFRSTLLNMNFAYTKKMGLEQGDEFEITLGRKHIHLRQIGVDDED